MSRRSASSRHRAQTSFADVLHAARNGEQWAFRTLFDSLASPIAAFVRARAGDDTDDLVNEIFLGSFTSLPRFEGSESDYRAWVFRIARNKINDHHRRNFRRVEQNELDSNNDVVSSPHTESAFLVHEQRERIEELLDSLTPDQRDVILLRVLADLSIAHVSQILGKPPGAIKSLQQRALQTLKRNNPALAVSS